MIARPGNWREIGQPIPIERIEEIIAQVVAETPCNSLSLSGGIDSTLLLYFMIRTGKNPQVFTVASSPNHPDVIHAKMAVEHFGALEPNCIREHHVHIPLYKKTEVGKNPDVEVKLLYKLLKDRGIDSIITGDGVDEFMCGYYGHQASPTHGTYQDYLQRLVPEHLEQLNKNSGDVHVYLPYLDRRVILLLAQLPLERKVGVKGASRKLPMIEMAQRAGLPEDIIHRRKYGFCSAMEEISDPSVKAAV